jgi:hypothetical protein
MVNRKQQGVLMPAVIVALLFCAVGSVNARVTSPPLKVALASVYNVNEMSERGPLPLLAIYPDGRVTFPTTEGDYKVVRYTAAGANGLVSELRSALTPRPSLPISPSEISTTEAKPNDPSEPPPTVFIDNCPSDVGEIEVAFFGEQPTVANFGESLMFSRQSSATRRLVVSQMLSNAQRLQPMP